MASLFFFNLENKIEKIANEIILKTRETSEKLKTSH